MTWTILVQYPRLVTPIRLMDGRGKLPKHNNTSGVALAKTRATVQPLSRIQFDDQRLIDVLRHVATIGYLLELAFELVLVDVDPGRKTRLLGERQCFLDAALLLGLFAHGDHVAGVDQHRRDAGGAAVERDRAMRDKLARLCTRRTEAHPIDDVVQARLEQGDEILAGVALASRCLGEVAAELPLEHAVHALDLLLLAQLHAEVGRANARDAAVLAGF